MKPQLTRRVRNGAVEPFFRTRCSVLSLLKTAMVYMHSVQKAVRHGRHNGGVSSRADMCTQLRTAAALARPQVRRHSAKLAIYSCTAVVRCRLVTRCPASAHPKAGETFAMSACGRKMLNHLGPQCLPLAFCRTTLS